LLLLSSRSPFVAAAGADRSASEASATPVATASPAFDLIGSTATVGRAVGAHGLGPICRRAADSGHAVVAAVDDPREVAVHAHTLAVLVAGRLVHWATPALVMSPALRLLDRGTESLDLSRSSV
jgi:hypothetical protein